MRRPSPAARTMALAGLTDISEISRSVVPGIPEEGSLAPQSEYARGIKITANHTMAIPGAHHWLAAIVVRHDDGTTAATTRVQVSAAARRAAFFFLSPVLRKLTPIWSPLTQASSQRR